MARDVERIMSSLCETLANEAEASADLRNARSLYDHDGEGLLRHGAEFDAFVYF